jgi:hypothetical protein
MLKENQVLSKDTPSEPNSDRSLLKIKVFEITPLWIDRMKNRKQAFVYDGFDIIQQKFEEQESGTFLLNIPELDRIHELH